MNRDNTTPNDLEWIIKDDNEIDFYLSEVTKAQFIRDVKALISKSSDKGVVRDAIKKLQELL